MARSRSFLQQIPPRFATSSALPTRDAQGEPLIRLQTLGAATILVGEMRLSAAADTLFALLLRIAYAPGLMLGRDQLVAALWPDQAQARQRANLRQSLYKLRSHGVRIAMVGDVVQLDATQLITTFALDRSFATFERDVTHGTEPFGVFLPGFTVRWLEYQEWVLQLREVVHADVRRVLVEQLRMRRERADWGGADALARWLLQFDPLNEEATLTVAECTALSGSKKEALAIIDRYLEELGPLAGDLRLPATMLRRRISDMGARTRALVSPTERYFVGREAEMAELTLAMRRAKWRDGSAVLLSGAAGIGKSRLIREFEKVAELEGFLIAKTSCRDTELSRALSVFLDLLPQIVALPGALGCAPSSLAALTRLLPKGFLESPQQSTIQSHSNGEDGSTNGEAARAIGDARETVSNVDPNSPPSSVRRAIVDVVSAVAHERPLAIVVEDVHWIDDQSWEALIDLLDRIDGVRVFVVLTSRERQARPVPPQRTPMRLQSLALEPLDGQRSRELAQAVADDLSAPLDEQLETWFARAGEGLPLFLHALVCHWVETGEAGGVPPTLRGVIEQRLSRLDSTALLLLQVASLLGRWATLERVQTVLELRTNELLGAISQAEALAVFSLHQSALVQPHDLLAAACVDRLSTLTRQAIHTRIASALRSEFRTNLDAELLLAAVGHYECAGCLSVVVREIVSDAHHLVHAPAPTRVIALLDRLWNSTTEGLDRGRIARLRTVVHSISGEFSKALEAPAAITPLSSDISSEQVEFAISMAEASFRADPQVDRLATADSLIELVRSPQLEAFQRLRAADAVLRALANDGERARAEIVVEALEAISVESELETQLKSTLIVYHSTFGSCETARAIGRELLEQAMASEASVQSYSHAMRAGVALRIAGDGREHLEALEIAFKVADQLYMPYHALNMAFHAAHSHLESGNSEQLSRWIGEIERVSSKQADERTTNFIHTVYCRAALEANDLEAARAHLSNFRKHVQRRTSRKNRCYDRSLELAIALASEDATIDRTMVETLQSDVDAMAAFGTMDYSIAILAESLDRLGHATRARESVREYISDVRRESFEVGMRLRRTMLGLGIEQPKPGAPHNRSRA